MRFLVAFCVLLFALPVCAAEQENIRAGFIKRIEGKAFIDRNTQKAAVAGEQILVGDVLLTGSGSRLAVVFEDGSRLTLDEESQLKVEEYVFIPSRKEYGFTLFLQKGTAIYSSGKLGKLAPEKVKLRTPRATVGIRGTKLLLSVR